MFTAGECYEQNNDIGNLDKEPDFRQTQSGTAVATFSVATTERWKNAEGEKQEHTEWHRIVAWRRLAEMFPEFSDIRQSETGRCWSYCQCPVSLWFFSVTFLR